MATEEQMAMFAQNFRPPAEVLLAEANALLDQAARLMEEAANRIAEEAAA